MTPFEPLPPSPEAPDPADAAMREVLDRHNEHMELIVTSHEVTADSVQAGFEHHLANTPPEHAVTLYRGMERNTENVLRHTPGVVAQQMGETAQELMTALPDSDAQLLLGDVASAMKDFGIGSHYVTEAIDRASSDTAKQAIRTILDSRLASYVQYQIQSFGVDSHYVTEAMQLASTPSVYKALQASIDAQVLDFARDNVLSFGVDSHYVREAILSGSTESVRKLIKSSLDGMVLQHAAYNAETFGIDNHYVTEVVNHGSSYESRTLMRESLALHAGEDGRLPRRGRNRIAARHQEYQGLYRQHYNYGLTNADVYGEIFNNARSAYERHEPAPRSRRPRASDSQPESPAPSHRPERRSKLTRRQRLALRLGATVAAAGAVLGLSQAGVAAYSAYQHHEAGIERTDARGQRNIGDIVRPSINEAGQEFVDAYNHAHGNGWTATVTPDGKYEMLQQPYQNGDGGEAIVSLKTIHTPDGTKKVLDASHTVWADWSWGAQPSNPSDTSNIGSISMTAPGGVQEAQAMSVLVPDELQGEQGWGNFEIIPAETSGDGLPGSLGSTENPDNLNYYTQAGMAHQVATDAKSIPPFGQGS